MTAKTMEEKKKAPKLKLTAYLRACSEYLRRPKTVFDLKDRSKALLLLTAAVMLLQALVRWLCP